MISSVFRTSRLAGILLSAVCVLLLACSCTPRHAPLPTDAAGRYNPVKIASNIQGLPNSFAWSHDGTMLAFLTTDTVNLYDAGTGAIRVIRLEGAHALNWSPAGRILVLAKENGQDTLCTIDPATNEIGKTQGDADAAAVYAAGDGQHMLLVSKRISRLSYGTRIDLRVSSLAPGRSPATLYSFTKIYPMLKPDLTALSAWVHAGLNPADNSLLMIELVTPPAADPYSKVLMMDPVSGEASELGDRLPGITSISAQWSPDGKQIALTRGDGSLEIRPVHGTHPVLDLPAVGFYPSWSPQGDRVYAGGRVITLDGSNQELLLPNAAWSIGAWSPDGTMLAAQADGSLWLFKGMPRMQGNNRSALNRAQKMLLLQDLFRDGLIALRDYQERRILLWKDTGGLGQ